MDKTSDTPLCRLCNEKAEIIIHIVSACSILAKSQYRKRHDKVETYVHCLLCKKYLLQYSGKWYIHKSQLVQENDEYKVLWDFNVKRDKVIEHRRPELLVSSSKTEIVTLLILLFLVTKT